MLPEADTPHGGETPELRRTPELARGLGEVLLAALHDAARAVEAERLPKDPPPVGP